MEAVKSKCRDLNGVGKAMNNLNLRKVGSDGPALKIFKNGAQV